MPYKRMNERRRRHNWPAYMASGAAIILAGLAGYHYSGNQVPNTIVNNQIVQVSGNGCCCGANRGNVKTDQEGDFPDATNIYRETGEKQAHSTAGDDLLSRSGPLGLDGPEGMESSSSDPHTFSESSSKPGRYHLFYTPGIYVGDYWGPSDPIDYRADSRESIPVTAPSLAWIVAPITIGAMWCWKKRRKK